MRIPEVANEDGVRSTHARMRVRDVRSQSGLRKRSVGTGPTFRVQGCG